MHIVNVKIERPPDVRFILGQAPAKTVENMQEIFASAASEVEFGLASCEASGKCLVRWSGNDPAMIELAKWNALAIGAGNGFVIFYGAGFYPLHVLNAVKLAPEACSVFFPTESAAEVVIAAGGGARGILGVVDGMARKGMEGNGREWKGMEGNGRLRRDRVAQRSPAADRRQTLGSDDEAFRRNTGRSFRKMREA